MKQTVVLYPGAGVGHFGSMTELAHVFLNHGYDVTMVLIELPVKSSDSSATAIERIAAANPSISFHVLPFLPVPDITASGKHPFIHLLQLLHDYNELLEAFLRSLPRERLHSLVLDMFCVAAIDVCAKLGVPVYTFFASGASFLSVMTQFPALIAGRQTGLKDLGDTPLDFLGVPPMPAPHLVKELLEHPEEEMCQGARGQVMGAAGGRALPPGDRRVLDALWVELGAGGHRGGSAHALLAAGGGAEDEQDVHDGGGHGSGGGAGGVHGGLRHGGRTGGQGEAGDRGRGWRAAQGATAGSQGRGGGGGEGGSSRAAFVQFLLDVENIGELHGE